MTKKLLALILGAMLTLGLSACGETTGTVTTGTSGTTSSAPAVATATP